MSAEQKVREAAAALLLAVSEAKAAGLIVQWPSRLEGLAALAISETGRAKRPTVTNLDGSPVERDADGVIRGEPLDLTDDERAALPALADDEREMHVVGKPEPLRIRGKRKRS